MLLSATAGFSAEVFLNRKVKSGEKVIRSVMLLPPTAYTGRKFDATDFRKIFIHNPLSTKVPEREEERAEALASEIGGIVSSALRKSGLQAVDTAFSSEALQNDLKMKNLVDSLLANHEILVRRMIRRPKDTAKGRYSLGQDVTSLSAASPSDVAVLVYGTPHWILKGSINPIKGFKIAKDIMPRPQWNGQPRNAFLHISLVDVRSGEVLCYLQIPGAVEDRILDGLAGIPH